MKVVEKFLDQKPAVQGGIICIIASIFATAVTFNVGFTFGMQVNVIVGIVGFCVLWYVIQARSKYEHYVNKEAYNTIKTEVLIFNSILWTLMYSGFGFLILGGFLFQDFQFNIILGALGAMGMAFLVSALNQRFHFVKDIGI